MHRPRHSHVIWKLQLAALLLLLVRLLIPVAVVMAALVVLTGESDYSQITMILWGSILVLSVFQWIFASGGKCPLCLMPVLARKGCSKHRNAAKVGGSHRFPVALSILFRGHFRCPYCNEPTVLEVREQPTTRRS